MPMLGVREMISDFTGPSPQPLTDRSMPVSRSGIGHASLIDQSREIKAEKFRTRFIIIIIIVGEERLILLNETMVALIDRL